jgi:hypothetical protein
MHRAAKDWDRQSASVVLGWSRSFPPAAKSKQQIRSVFSRTHAPPKNRDRPAAKLLKYLKNCNASVKYYTGFSLLNIVPIRNPDRAAP